MKFTSLQMRLMIIFGFCLLITIASVGVYGVYSTRNTEEFVTSSLSDFATVAAKEQLFEKARAMGFHIRTELEVALDSARTLANVLSGIKDQRVNLNIDRDRINSILQSALTRNETFVGISTAWEPNALDQLDDLYAETGGHDQTGRFIPYWGRSEDGIIRLEPLVDYENPEPFENGVRKGEYYLLPRERKTECAIDPYPSPVQGEIFWMTSLVVPIVADDTFYGIVGVDMRLDIIQSLVEQGK